MSELAYQPQRAGRLAWVISYADIMSIILTFFILILSISRVSSTRYEALTRAFGQSENTSLEDVQGELEEVIEQMGIEHHVRTRLDEDGLSVELANSVLFASGEAELTPEAQELLSPIGERMAASLDERYDVVVEGYTDDVPIHNRRYQSNWELSTSRAIYVMEQLVRAGLGRERLSVQGFADTRAQAAERVESGETSLDDARAEDRRVVLRVVEVNRTTPGERGGER